MSILLIPETPAEVICLRYFLQTFWYFWRKQVFLIKKKNVFSPEIKRFYKKILARIFVVYFSGPVNAALNVLSVLAVYYNKAPQIAKWPDCSSQLLLLHGFDLGYVHFKIFILMPSLASMLCKYQDWLCYNDGISSKQ